MVAASSTVVIVVEVAMRTSSNVDGASGSTRACRCADLLDQRRRDVLVERAVGQEVGDRLRADRVGPAPAGVVDPAAVRQAVTVQDDRLVHRAMEAGLL